jgi:hypothetical protein
MVFAFTARHQHTQDPEGHDGEDGAVQAGRDRIEAKPFCRAQPLVLTGDHSGEQSPDADHQDHSSEQRVDSGP